MQEILHFRDFTLRNLWYCSAGLWCSQLSYFITVESVLWLHPKTKHAADAKNWRNIFIPRERFHPVCKFRGWDDSDVEPPELSLSISEKVFSVLLLSVLTHLFPTSIRPHQHLWVVPASAARLPQPYRPFERRRSRHVPAPARGV